MLGITLFTALLITGSAGTLDNPPPGLVPLKGGKTKVGTPVKVVEEMILEFQDMAKPLAGETPQVTIDVDDCYLMPNEVTMEQYAAFVRATGSKPPWLWGGAAVDKGRKEFLDEQNRKAEEAKAAGQRVDRKKFDAERWWDANWEGCEWEVPTDELTAPVVYVSYREAQAYARWAGLRLMTEFEFTRAARRNTDHVYTWGDEFDPTACNSLHAGEGRTAMVGSYPASAVEGIHDLCGNVWEWTASPYEKFKGYKPIRVKDGKRTIEAIAPWDSNQRVLVSGSFQQNRVGVRIATRMWAERMQSTDALGFRCAATPAKGVDAALAVIDNDVRWDVLPSDIGYYPEGSVIMQKWESADGTVDKVEGYKVITGYERMMFTPVKTLQANNVKKLADDSVADGPIFLGFISIDQPLMEPTLDVGTYHIAYRGAGDLPDTGEEEADPDTEKVAEDDGETPYWDALGFDAETAQFIFYDLEGTPLVCQPASKFKFEKLKGYNAPRIERWVPPKKIDKDDPPIPMDTLRFSVEVAGKSAGRGFRFDLFLKCGPDMIEDDWL